MGHAARVAEHEAEQGSAGLVAAPSKPERSTSAQALANAGSAAIARISEDPAGDSAHARLTLLRQLHGQLRDAALAEYEAWGQVRQHAADQLAVHGVSVAENALVDGVSGTLAEAWHSVGGRKPTPDVRTRSLVDESGWNRLFELLNQLDAAIVEANHAAATQLALRCSAALREEHALTLASTQQHRRGAGAAATQLGVVVTGCVLIESVLSAGTVGAGAGLLKVGAMSALGAGASRTLFVGVETAAERARGMQAHGWWDPFIAGGEDAVTTFVATVASGALAVKFIPKLARYVSEHVGADVLLKLGKLLDLMGPLPREYFLGPGRILLVNFLSGAGAGLLTTPVHVLYERLVAGHKISLDQFIEELPGEIMRAGLFQALLAGLFHAQAMRADPSRKPLVTEGLDDDAAMQALMQHDGTFADDAAIEARVAKVRRDPAAAPAIENVVDADAKGITGYSGADYRSINLVSRMKDKRLGKVLKPYVDHAARGLHNMAPHKGWVHRGIKHMANRDLRRYQVGEVVTEDAFTSTSKNDDAAFSGSVRMKLYSETGADVSMLSQYPEQAEVLFPPGTRFLVTERVDLPDGSVKLQMQEVP